MKHTYVVADHTSNTRGYICFSSTCRHNAPFHLLDEDKYPIARFESIETALKHLGCPLDGSWSVRTKV